MEKTTGADFHFIIGTKDLQYNKKICDKNFSKIKSSGSSVSEHFLQDGVHAFEANFPVEWLPSSEYPTFTNCDLQFFNDGSYFESETNSKIRMEADVDLKNKYQIRKDFVFKTIKKCYGKGNWMGSQGNILKKNFILLEEITSKYFN